MEALDPLQFLQLTLFKIGDKAITPASLLLFAISLLLLIWVAGALQRWLSNRLLARTHLDLSTRDTIGTLVRYAVLVFGFMVLAQNVGINLSSLSVLAGAIGVGVGFGLQNIFSNFISGLIVMFERPIKIGDRIEVAGFEGDVVAIAARATTLRTNRGATVIVPNQRFITDPVRNWDVGLHGGATTSITLPVKVAYESDPAIVGPLLATIAGEQDGVLDSRPPVAYLLSADAGGYAFELQVWLRGDPEQRSKTLSTLLTRLHAGLRVRGIKVA